MRCVTYNKQLYFLLVWLRLAVGLLTIAVLLYSCKKLVEVPSPGNLQTSESVYSNDGTATAVVTGIYSGLSASSITINTVSLNTISMATGLQSDELTLFGGAANANSSLVQVYLNKLTAGFPTIPNPCYWYSTYSSIYTVNQALEKLNQSAITPSVKQQLTGELKFLRAFFYFYLVNLYGDVPLTTTSDYRFNSSVARTPKADVYKQIIADLKQAQELLSENYVGADSKSTTAERIRVNKWAAAALLARAYLYTGDWSDAEAQATAVINQNSKYALDSLNGTFLKDSKEAIFQLQPITVGWNTFEAYVFVLPPTGPTANSTTIGNPVYLSDELLNSFETNDQRKKKWLEKVTVSNSASSGTYYFPYKYKNATLNAPLTEYETVLRLAEQYLIRGEARARQNKVNEAQNDINIIRSRAGLPGINTSEEAALLAAILNERQHELFTEWGHRWFDLKRAGTVNQVMESVSQVKGTTWSNSWQWYPIPAYDLIQNPKLHQNDGY